MKKIIFTLFAISLFLGCDKDDPQKIFDDQLQADIAEIQTWLNENNIQAIQDPSGLFYVIDEEGTGNNPTSSAFVSMTYTGRFFGGGIFDSRDATNPLKANLFDLIVGWRIGIPKFKKGGSGKLYIPSGLAYGTRGAGSIPANTNLIFDIELLDFN